MVAHGLGVDVEGWIGEKRDFGLGRRGGHFLGREGGGVGRRVRFLLRERQKGRKVLFQISQRGRQRRRHRQRFKAGRRGKARVKKVLEERMEERERESVLMNR